MTDTEKMIEALVDELIAGPLSDMVISVMHEQEARPALRLALTRAYWSGVADGIDTMGNSIVPAEV